METKSYYGNDNYGLIDSNIGAMAGQDIPMPQTAKKLPYPTTTGYFFETIKDEALDTFDKIIKITKRGHLKLTIKTNIFTNGGVIDFQLYRMHLDTSYAAARRRSFKDGYIEINFDIDVDVGDRIYIYIQASVGDACLKYIPVDGYLIEQSAYIINMDLIEPFDDIGSLVWSIDPNLANYNNCIKLDGSKPLLIDDYPLLYAKLSGTPYIENDDGVNFTIKDLTQYPYLRSGSSLSLLKQNLPDPLISSNFSNGISVSNNDTDAEAFFGGNDYLYDSSADNFSGCFLADSAVDSEEQGWGRKYLAGSGLNLNIVNLVMSDHTHTIDGAVTSITTDTINYSSDQNVRPNTAQMFLYMICDNQL